MSKFSAFLAVAALSYLNNYDLEVRRELALQDAKVDSARIPASLEADYANLSKSLMAQIPEFLRPLEALDLQAVSANLRAHAKPVSSVQ